MHTAFAVQGHVFNDQFEKADLSVFNYLMKENLEIVTFSMANKIQEYWSTYKIEWHIDRGLRINTEATGPNSDKYITNQNLASMKSDVRRLLVKQARQGVFCISARVPGTLTPS